MTGLLELPDGLFLAILARVDPESHKAFCATCVRASTAPLRPPYKRLTLDFCAATQPALSWPRDVSLTKLHLVGSYRPADTDKLSSFIQRVQQERPALLLDLAHLHIEGWQFNLDIPTSRSAAPRAPSSSQRAFQALAALAPYVSHITLHGSDAQDSVLETLLRLWPDVKHLRLLRTRHTSPTAWRLAIPTNPLTHLTTLTSLQLLNPGTTYRASIDIQALPTLTLLQDLSLSLPALNITGLGQISQSCTQLTRLVLIRNNVYTLGAGAGYYGMLVAGGTDLHWPSLVEAYVAVPGYDFLTLGLHSPDAAPALRRLSVRLVECPATLERADAPPPAGGAALAEAVAALAACAAVGPRLAVSCGGAALTDALSALRPLGDAIHSLVLHDAVPPPATPTHPPTHNIPTLNQRTGITTTTTTRPTSTTTPPSHATTLTSALPNAHQLTLVGLTMASAPAWAAWLARQRMQLHGVTFGVRGAHASQGRWWPHGAELEGVGAVVGQLRRVVGGVAGGVAGATQGSITGSSSARGDNAPDHAGTLQSSGMAQMASTPTVPTATDRPVAPTGLSGEPQTATAPTVLIQTGATPVSVMLASSDRVASTTAGPGAQGGATGTAERPAHSMGPECAAVASPEALCTEPSSHVVSAQALHGMPQLGSGGNTGELGHDVTKASNAGAAAQGAHAVTGSRPVADAPAHGSTDELPGCCACMPALSRSKPPSPQASTKAAGGVLQETQAAVQDKPVTAERPSSRSLGPMVPDTHPAAPDMPAIETSGSREARGTVPAQQGCVGDQLGSYEQQPCTRVTPTVPPEPTTSTDDTPVHPSNTPDEPHDAHNTLPKPGTRGQANTNTENDHVADMTVFFGAWCPAAQLNHQILNLTPGYQALRALAMQSPSEQGCVRVCECGGSSAADGVLCVHGESWQCEVWVEPWLEELDGMYRRYAEERRASEATSTFRQVMQSRYRPV